LLLRVPQHLAEEWRHRSQEFADQAGGPARRVGSRGPAAPWG
jgi:hypothetical protein